MGVNLETGNHVAAEIFLWFVSSGESYSLPAGWSMEWSMDLNILRHVYQRIFSLLSILLLLYKVSDSTGGCLSISKNEQSASVEAQLPLIGRR